MRLCVAFRIFLSVAVVTVECSFCSVFENLEHSGTQRLNRVLFVLRVSERISELCGAQVSDWSSTTTLTFRCSTFHIGEHQLLPRNSTIFQCIRTLRCVLNLSSFRFTLICVSVGCSHWGVILLVCNLHISMLSALVWLYASCYLIRSGWILD